MRLIDADALVARFSLWLEDDNYADGNTYADIAEDFIIPSINEAPTIEAEPVRRGRWEITEAYPHNVHCSVCHKRFAQTHWTVWEDGSLPRAYCPNCGAKMEGEEEV